ncbi:MAG TPA: tRNA (adenosine(37)-N6)-dimethylallyltransferase MiaA [Pararhizobium sp.]|nr:tRNA (adenosine(37)-N6)-dimethylallyltransferase MiaA [Pararhizobium sp.]
MDAILIAGPTASGKSALAMELARRHGGVIVNADSVQVYDVLPILTAQPSAKDKAAVEHRLYGHVSAATAYSTGAWYRDIGDVLNEIRATQRIPVIVGGTGLYFRALMGGLSEMPEVPDHLRIRWRGRLSEEGAAALHQELERRDRQVARRLGPADGQRIVRALEVLDATGTSIADYQKKAGTPLVDEDRSLKLVVLPERARLHHQIALRFDAMMEAGAMDEVRSLLALGLDPRLPAMRAIGVRELQEAILGKSEVADAREHAIAASRQYAKRQITWFRNQLDEKWQTIQSAEFCPQRGIEANGLKIP